MSLGDRCTDIDSDTFVTELYGRLLLGQRVLWTTLHSLLNTLSGHDQKTVFDIILRDLSRKYLRSEMNIACSEAPTPAKSAAVSGVAAMVNGLVQSNTVMEEHLLHWLTSTNGDYVGLGVGARRAVIANLAQKQGKNSHTPTVTTTKSCIEKLRQILDKSLASFGSKFQIQHDGMLQQECK